MQLEFIPITPQKTEIEEYLHSEFCQEIFKAFESLYQKVGFVSPWIGYFAKYKGEIIGVGGFKYPPINNTVEIAYSTIPEHEGKGFATAICRKLAEIAIQESDKLRIIARTLMEENASTKILKKNNFKFIGVVNDPEDGEVWEWEFGQ